MRTLLPVRFTPGRSRSSNIDSDGDSISGIPGVVQVIAVLVVVDIHIIVVVPVIRPIFWPRINQTEPEAAVLETGIPADQHHRVPVNAEPVLRTKVAPISILWNPVAVVATTLLPGAVLRF